MGVEILKFQHAEGGRQSHALAADEDTVAAQRFQPKAKPIYCQRRRAWGNKTCVNVNVLVQLQQTTRGRRVCTIM